MAFTGCSSVCRPSSARSGREQVIEIELTADEYGALQRSAESVRELVTAMAAL